MKQKIFALMVSIAVLSLPVAWAQRSKIAKEAKADVLKEKLDKGEKVLIIDVREDDEVKSGSMPGAIHIPLGMLEQRMKDIPKDVELVFTWNGGGRSSRAAELFEKNGYKTASFCPLNGWKAKEYKLDSPKKPGDGPIKP